MHLLDTGMDRILFDCGMFQGRRKESKEKNKTFPIDKNPIANMVLSHAHIDHCGFYANFPKTTFTQIINCSDVGTKASRSISICH